MKFAPADRGGKIRLALMVAVLAVLAFVYREQTVFLYSRLPVIYHYLAYTPREGDVVFQSLPDSGLVDAIEGVTHSPYSHCGVVLRNDKGQWVVLESIVNVHETPLLLWELRGRGGGFDVYRLDPKYDSLQPKFKAALLGYIGRSYDYDYDMSKGTGVYCSSVIYLAFAQASGEKLGKLERLRDLDWKPYEEFIKSEQSGLLPLDRLMITPASLAAAERLHKTYRGIFRQK